MEAKGKGKGKGGGREVDVGLTCPTLFRCCLICNISLFSVSVSLCLLNPSTRLLLLLLSLSKEPSRVIRRYSLMGDTNAHARMIYSVVNRAGGL